MMTARIMRTFRTGKAGTPGLPDPRSAARGPVHLAVAVAVVETTRHGDLLAAARPRTVCDRYWRAGPGGGGVAYRRAVQRDSPIPPPGKCGSPPAGVKPGRDRRTTAPVKVPGARTREAGLDSPSSGSRDRRLSGMGGGPAGHPAPRAISRR